MGWQDVRQALGTGKSSLSVPKHVGNEQPIRTLCPLPADLEDPVTVTTCAARSISVRFCKLKVGIKQASECVWLVMGFEYKKVYNRTFELCMLQTMPRERQTEYLIEKLEPYVAISPGINRQL